tara:strand:- start:184 stop:642 length:459 start_codon:yes stop_codon:yes gene_type:complete
VGDIFRHVGIVVSNLDVAIDLYINLFNYELKARYENTSGRSVDMLVGIQNACYDAAIIKLPDNNRLELIEYKSHNGAKRKPVLSNDIGCSHFAISVQDIDKIYQARASFPIKFVNPPHFDGAVKLAYAVIMEECLIEIVEVVDEKAHFSGGP